MKLIVGLGNPGRKYQGTRHNVGFIVAAKVAQLTSASSPKVKFEGELAETLIGGEKVGILCPETYMNASGRSVRKAVDFYKLAVGDLLVICDDLNLPSGRLRLRPSGSAGGQNGIKDIIRHLGSEAFPRLRVGIGRPPPDWSVTDYVLGKFTPEEQEQFEQTTTRAAHAAIDFINEGVDQAMSRYNGAPDAGTGRKRTAEKAKSQRSSASRSVPPSDRDRAEPDE
jgi:PTH1 family peptidyl-tRNA hydrolase